MNKLNLSALLEKAHEAKQECIEKNGFYSQKAEKFMKSLDLNTVITLCEALIEAREAFENIDKAALSGDGTSTECEMAYLAQDTLSKINGTEEKD